MNYTFVIFQRSRTLTYNVVVRQSPTRAIIWLIFGHGKRKGMLFILNETTFELPSSKSRRQHKKDESYSKKYVFGLGKILKGNKASHLRSTCAFFWGGWVGDVLRLSLAGSPKSEPEETCALPSKLEKTSEKYSKESSNPISSIRGPDVTPYSNPELGRPFTATEVGTSSVSSSDPSISPFFIPEMNSNLKQGRLITHTRNAPSGPPPLYSIFQHKAPVFGKPPRWFSYAELELATDGFSEANFLAEGGFGSVHRGVLPDGQAVAVKQHKLASSQGDHEFCSEVEVLSCAQHRNVVMLIGFCVEDRRRLLVYEYICNSSLDSHLYATIRMGGTAENCSWAARGLRYLHEECRVGCIVHRDMRPNNILITHDFEPLILGARICSKRPITEKADVYSFGVVLVELVTGRKAVDINRPKGQWIATSGRRQNIFIRIVNNYENQFCHSVTNGNRTLNAYNIYQRRLEQKIGEDK
ncbi:non-specific serine/threonine protein kinase [Ranunculus cassubicifolius]